MEEQNKKLPCIETGECQCITIEDLKKTNRKIKKLAKEIEDFEKNHECVQKDRIIQLENRQDQKFDKIMDKQEETNIKIQQVADRLDKKREQNGHTRDEVAHIHQEESDLAKEVAIIKDKLADHEKIVTAIEGMNERLIKQEERHQALLDSIKLREDEEIKFLGQKRSKTQIIFQVILIISAVLSGAWVIIKEVLRW